MPSANSSGKTACRVEVLGRISSMAFSPEASAVLVTTVLNGAHIFHMDDSFYGPNLFSGLSNDNIEKYPYKDYSPEPSLSSCFLGSGDRLIALGSASGTISVVSRLSRSLTGIFKFPLDDTECPTTGATKYPHALRSLHPAPAHPSTLLACTEAGGHVIDMDRSTLVSSLENPAPRAVAAVPLATPASYAVANYDGKVLLYDVRSGPSPHSVLSVPDQITSMTVCPQTGQTCVGTVAGRVFILRCTDGMFREQSFGTGRKRSPISSVSMWGTKVVTGDLAGRLTVMDSSDVPNPTKYWTPQTLLTPNERALWKGAEVSATLLTHGIAWASFCTPESSQSHLVAQAA